MKSTVVIASGNKPSCTCKGDCANCAADTPAVEPAIGLPVDDAYINAGAGPGTSHYHEVASRFACHVSHGYAKYHFRSLTWRFTGEIDAPQSLVFESDENCTSASSSHNRPHWRRQLIAADRR